MTACLGPKAHAQTERPRNLGYAAMHFISEPSPGGRFCNYLPGDPCASHKADHS